MSTLAGQREEGQQEPRRTVQGCCGSMGELRVAVELERGATIAGGELCALVTVAAPPRGGGGKLERLACRLAGLERAAPEVHAALPAPPARAFGARQGHWWTRELLGGDARLLLCGPCRLEPGARRCFLVRLRLPPELPPSLPRGTLVRRTYALEASAAPVGSLGGRAPEDAAGAPGAFAPLHVWSAPGRPATAIGPPLSAPDALEAVELPGEGAIPGPWGALIAEHFPGGEGGEVRGSSPAVANEATPISSPRGRRASGDGLMPLFLSPSRYRRSPSLEGASPSGGGGGISPGRVGEDGVGNDAAAPSAATPAAGFTIAISGRPLAEMRLEGLRGQEVAPGAVMGGTLDFSPGLRGGLACSAFEAQLEALERCPLLPEPRGGAAALALCQVSEDVSRLGRTFFMMQVPLRAPTSCAAEHVELSWRLRFTFHVFPDDGGAEESLGWEIPVRMVPPSRA